MAKSKNAKRIKVRDYQSEDQIEAMQFIKILVILIVIVLAIYFFTRIFVTKDLIKNTEETVVEGSIDYSKAIIGNMLNKADKEYYVIIYDSESLDSSYYNSIVSSYLSESNSLPVYTVDLKSEFNKNYYDKDNVNLNTNDINNLRVGDITLFKVKDGKITKTIDNDTDLLEELTSD